MSDKKLRFQISPAVGHDHATTLRGIEFIAALNAKTQSQAFDMPTWRLQLYKKLLSEDQYEQCCQFSPQEESEEKAHELQAHQQVQDKVEELHHLAANPQWANPFLDTSSPSHTLLIRTPECVTKNVDPMCILALLHLPKQPTALHHATYKTYKKCYAFVNELHATAQLPDHIIPIRSSVDKNIFCHTPLKNRNKASAILLIAASDQKTTAQALCWLHKTSAHAIYLFDPFHKKPPNGPWQPTACLMANDDVSPSQRAAFYARCTAVWVADPKVHVDNHFLCEAMALGRPSLSQFADEHDIWDIDILSAATERATTSGTTSPPISDMIDDWQNAVDIICKTIDDINPNQPVRIVTTANATHVMCQNVEQALDTWSQQSVKQEDSVCYLFAHQHWLSQPLLDKLLSQMGSIVVSADVPAELLAQLEPHTDRLSLKSNIHELHEHMLTHQHPQIVLALYFDVTPESLNSSTKEYLSICMNAPVPKQRTRLPTSLYGAAVATTITAMGLHDAAQEAFNVKYWSRYSKKNHYFCIDEPSTEYNNESFETLDIQHMLKSNKIAAFIEYSPYLNRLMRARDAWANRPTPIIGFLHSIHNGLLSPIMHSLLQNDMYAYDCIVSPSHCGTIALQKLIGSIKAWSLKNLKFNINFDARFEMVPYGLEPQPFQDLDKAACRHTLELPEDGIILFSLGRFARSEKADLMPLLLAFKELVNRNRNKAIPNVYLVLAGATLDQPYLHEVKEAIAQLQITSRIHIKTQVDTADKIMLYGAADIFVAVNDSIQETYGYALVEAMACGLPIVAAAWNGHREIVADGENGFLVPTYCGGFNQENLIMNQMTFKEHDDVNNDLNQSMVIDVPHLIESLCTLVTDPIRRQAFGHASRARCYKHYLLEDTSKRILRIIEDSVALASQHELNKSKREPTIDPVLSRFAHYAVHSTHAEQPAVFFISVGDDIESLQMILRITAINDSKSKDLAKQIVAIVSSAGTIELQPLVQQLTQQSDIAAAMIEAHIMRLSKYNILRIHT